MILSVDFLSAPFSSNAQSARNGIDRKAARAEKATTWSRGFPLSHRLTLSIFLKLRTFAPVSLATEGIAIFHEFWNTYPAA